MAKKLVYISEDVQMFLGGLSNKLSQDVSMTYGCINNFAQSEMAQNEDLKIVLNSLKETSIDSIKIIRNLQDYNTPHGMPEVDALNTHVNVIILALEELNSFISDLEGKGNNRIRRTYGIPDITRLAKDLKILSGNVKELAKPLPTIKRIQKDRPFLAAAASTIKGGFLNVGKELIESIPLGSVALQFSQSVMSLGQQFKKENLGKTFESAATSSMSSDFGFNPMGGVPQGEFNVPGGADVNTTPLSGVMPGGGQAGKEQVENTNTGLFGFFNVGAFKAKWTKEIYEVLTGKKVPKEKDEEQKGLFDSLGQMITRQLLNPATLAVIGKSLGGIAAGAIAVYFALKNAKKVQQQSTEEGWLTDEPGKKQSWWQNLTSGIAGFVGGSGPGFFQKGSFKDKIGNVLKQGGIGAGLALGATTIAAPFTGGASLASIPLILGTIGAGAGIGATLGAIGPKVIAQALNPVAMVGNFAKRIQKSKEAMEQEYGALDPRTGLPLNPERLEQYKQDELARVAIVSQNAGVDALGNKLDNMNKILESIKELNAKLQQPVDNFSIDKTNTSISDPLVTNMTLGLISG